MLQITQILAIPESDYTLKAIRSQGAGGQNVNKVATAIHLTLDVASSSLPEPLKSRLLRERPVIVIKAQEFRTQAENRAAALERLRNILRAAMRTPKRRKPTSPTRSSREKRLRAKAQQSSRKALRQSPPE